MTVQRIFIANMGEFKDSAEYRFVADFSDIRTASEYVRFMRGQKRYAKQDIIIKEVSISEIDASDGTVSSVLSVLGESLPVEEFEFK